MTTLREFLKMIDKIKEKSTDEDLDAEVIFTDTVWPERDSNVYTSDFYGRSHTKKFGDCFLFYLDLLHKSEDDWDILELDNNMDKVWPHVALQSRLHDKNIECFFADMWRSDQVGFLLGCNANKTQIARALGMHEECVYVDFEHDFVILNLFQEKYLRGKENE